MLWLVGAALLLSLADALFLLVVATHIGVLNTVGLVVLTALFGVVLVRSEGRTTLARIQRRLARGEAPTDELVDGAMILIGAGFLITPGLLTDLTGFLLVVPVTRYPLRIACKRWIVGPYVRRKIDDGSISVAMGGSLGGSRSGQGGWGGPGTGPDSGPESGPVDDQHDRVGPTYDVEIEDVEDVNRENDATDR